MDNYRYEIIRIEEHEQSENYFSGWDGLTPIRIYETNIQTNHKEWFYLNEIIRDDLFQTLFGLHRQKSMERVLKWLQINHPELLL